MIDGTPPKAEWEKMDTDDIQRWAWTLRSWKRARKQQTPASARMRSRAERVRRRAEGSSATVNPEDYR
jgi:hypothetical protein